MSKINSSPLKTLIAKSSDPTTNSAYLSSSQSIKAIVCALSPVTVQKRSSEFLSRPVIEQLPPTTTIGSSTPYTLPKAIQFKPSAIS